MSDKIRKIIIGFVVVVIIVGGLFLIFGRGLMDVKSPIEKEISQLLKNKTLTEEQRNNLNEALDFLVENPNDAEAFLKLAMVKYQLEDYNGAIEVYYKALEIQPDNIVIYHNLGDIYSLQENWTKAEEMYLTIIAKTPKWISAYSNLATIYRFHLTEKYPDMEQILLDAIKNTTDIEEYAPVDLYIMLGTFYKRMENKANAIKYYEIALKIMPENETVERELDNLKK